MAERLGMDPAVVAAHTRQLRSSAAQLDLMASEVDAAVAAAHRQLASAAPGMLNPLPWARAAAGGVVVMSWGAAELAKNAAADIREAALAAEQLLGRLGVNITEQIDASSATEGYLDGLMSKAQAEQLYRRAMDDPSVLSELTPQQVRAWWQRLGEEEKNAFIRDHHWVAGNTNGIPFDRRIEANERSARVMLAGSDALTDEQRSYLSEVAEGKRSLISFDPGADRIIEMIGSIGPDTQNIVSYVPGTTSNMDGFYSRSTQEFSQYLVDHAAPPGSTVAFVYKDSPFPTFDERGVYHSSWAASVGDPYARFQTALGFENSGGVPVTSIEHSFASSVGGYAEMQGVEFDRRIVLGGIGMTDGWSPNARTEYYSFTGDNDVIRAARERHSEDLNTGYPHPPTRESNFIELDPRLPDWRPENYLFQGGILAPWMDTGMDPITQHKTVAGVDDNRETLGTVLEILGSK
jgi:hypothetical protein